MWNDEISQVRGNNLGIYLPRHHIPYMFFQDYIVLFWFFFFILGQDETSSWGIWKNSFDSNKHKFQLLYCLLWVALEFWINIAVHFMCCESYYVALFCDSDCDFVITFARTKWQHSCFIQYYLMIELLPQAEVYGFIMLLRILPLSMWPVFVFWQSVFWRGREHHSSWGLTL